MKKDQKTRFLSCFPCTCCTADHGGSSWAKRKEQGPACKIIHTHHVKEELHVGIVESQLSLQTWQQ